MYKFEKADPRNQIFEMLQIRNGFFTFENSLHVFPSGLLRQVITVERWNDQVTWKQDYGTLISNALYFFAQDVYGNQFGIDTRGISLFYSEFAECELIASSIGEWAEKILEDWRGFSGYDLAHEWQMVHRPLREGERLIPKIPFVVGGKYELENLYAGDIVDAMKFRGSLARQVSELPNGTKIKLNVKRPE